MQHNKIEYKQINMKFQYMSDLHLEMFPGFRIVPEQVVAPYLILAGDIGDPAEPEYTAFLTSCSESYARVFVILGNHEMYGKGVQETVSLVRAIADRAKAKNVTLLDRDAVDLVDDNGENVVRVLGCTLWSDVNDKDRSDVTCFIQDFRRISDLKSGGTTVYNHLHRVDSKWLRDRLVEAERSGVRCLVVTHHAPRITGTSHPGHAGSALNCAFSTDLEEMLRPPVAAWIHGHTHFSHATEVPHSGGVLLLANQRGYANVPREIKAFVPDAFVEL